MDAFPSSSVRWMYFRPKSGWKAFDFLDSVNIENSFQELLRSESNAPSEGEEDAHACTVQVEEGRYEVNLRSNEMRPVLWAERTAPVIRGTWFGLVTKDELIPIIDQDVSALELEWSQLDFTLDVPPTTSIEVVDHCSKKEMKLASGFFESVDFKAFDSIKRNDEYKDVSIWKLFRGYPNFKAGEEEDSSQKFVGTCPTGLVFVIHGIGDYCQNQNSTTLPTVVECASTLRTNTRKIVEKKYSSGTAEDATKNRPHFEFLPIDWTDSIRVGEELLSRVSLSSLKLVRDIMNEVLADVLFYMSGQDKVLEFVASAMNYSYEQFLKQYPDFSGKISIMGHSLGSVISHDLLQNQDKNGVENTENKKQLRFSPCAFFAFGSPIGQFQATKGKAYGMEYTLPTCPKIFNIYHPMDPVAYRIEPLVHKSFQQRPCVRIGTFEGGDRIHHVIGDFGDNFHAGRKELVNNVNRLADTVKGIFDRTRVINRFSGAKDREDFSAPIDGNDNDDEMPEHCGALNGGDRIDYFLQETPFEHVNQALAAIWAHNSYWDSMDFTLFVVETILNLSQQ